MNAMLSDRKVWTAMETKALITLKEEMKPKFESMKRNRALWVELSDKLRKHFGHDRTPAQCAVRWKNIMSAYKDSRDALCNLRPESKVCLFFKEVESILGDPPLTLPASNDPRVRSLSLPPPPPQSPKKRERTREQNDASVASLLSELIVKIDAQGAAIARIEKMLAKASTVNTLPTTDILPSAEPVPVPLPDTVIAPATETVKPFTAADTEVLLERPSTASPQSDTAKVAEAHSVTRHDKANSTDIMRSAEHITQETGVTRGNGDGDSAVNGQIGQPAQPGPISSSLVPTVVDRSGIDGTTAADRRGYDGPSAASRPAILITEDAVITVTAAKSEVEVVDGSIGGSTDVDITGGALEKETNVEGHVNKKQKVVHAYSSAS